jgi:hypothetical protein
MVGKTGRKCASQGMNVIAGGSQPMSNLYNASLSPHSRKIATQAPLFIPRIPSAKPLEATSRTGSTYVTVAPDEPEGEAAAANDPLGIRPYLPSRTMTQAQRRALDRIANRDDKKKTAARANRNRHGDDT